MSLQLVTQTTVGKDVMSLKSCDDDRVLEETARVIRSIYPQGTLYSDLYNAVGVLFRDEDFTHLFSHEGQPALSPIRLILVSILQYIEDLPDRRAAEAVRTRLDWKYLLCLELTDPGFHHSVLREFRSRLVDGSAEVVVMNRLLERFRERGLLRERGQQRTDSTHVLAAIRTMKRIECVGETLRCTLNTLSLVAPDWTRENTPADWCLRYGARDKEKQIPKSKERRLDYAEQTGRDGQQLLNALFASSESWLLQVPAVQVLWRVWIQSYT